MPDSFNFNKANLDQALMWIATQMRINPETRFVINIGKASPTSSHGAQRYDTPRGGFEPRKTFGSKKPSSRGAYTKSDSTEGGYKAGGYRKTSTGYAGHSDDFGDKKFHKTKSSFGGDKKFGPKTKTMGIKKETRGGPKRKG